MSSIPTYRDLSQAADQNSSIDSSYLRRPDNAARRSIRAIIEYMIILITDMVKG